MIMLLRRVWCLNGRLTRNLGGTKTNIGLFNQVFFISRPLASSQSIVHSSFGKFLLVSHTQNSIYSNHQYYNQNHYHHDHHQYHSHHYYQNQVPESLPKTKANSLLTYGSVLALFAYFHLRHRKSQVFAEEVLSSNNGTELVPGLEVAGLPEYTLEEVSKHADITDKSKGVWIVYKAGVYDVTSFVQAHPGGDNILLGAGNSVEPFWEVYGQHKTAQVYELLESFRIGNLRVVDRLKPSDLSSKENQNTEYVPERNPSLIVHHIKPYNAESRPDMLNTFITPNSDFFIRHHLSVPEVDPSNYELEVEGLTVEGTHTFTLEQLKQLFPKHSVTSVVQCAGNRRDALNQIKEVKGIAWGVGAISNAQWSGAKLVDVLRYCGAQLDNHSIRHVQFEGLDLDATSTPYGASVPADKALNPTNEFLLAYEMNGEPIPADHGFPVRLVAPGIVGARNVKWLGKVVLAEEESHSHWQRHDYKSFPSSMDSASNDQFAKAYSIQELPIQSAVCSPVEGATVPVRWKPAADNPDALRPVVEASGYAWSGGGRAVIRVDLSVDDGHTWHTAELEQEPDRPVHHTYSWTLWKADLPLQPTQLYQGKPVQIICRAYDSSYNVQPKNPEEIWNFRGLLNNSWHRVNVRL